ncbi:SHPS1 phosphatase, partial [Rostratula benghalensis]|nr:SHPS1 phosphatase [Rostratula benghalensis]
EDIKLHQPQDKVSVKAGEMLTLTCTISSATDPGPVRWLKGWGRGNQTIYEQTGSYPRVTREVDGSNTDFTIHIRDVQPEDAGTYYCVKFGRKVSGDELLRRGNGTEVSVLAKPTHPVVSGPSHRVGTGKSASFTCMAGGFFPADISVKWFKDQAPIKAEPPQVTHGRTKSSHNMTSTVTMTLREGDVRSQLICEVQHQTLPDPLRGTYQLSQALRVSPSVRVDADPPNPVGVNKTVKFTCHVKGFYPGEVAVTWLENGTEVNTQNTSRLVEMPRGLFQLSSLVEVKAVEEKNGSTFTCRVVHDAQDPVDRMATLWISAPARE